MPARQPPSSLTWDIRSRLGPRGRRTARLALDATLAGIAGSLGGATTTEPLVALTFDDGPDGRWTPEILAALGRHGAKATFFLLPARAESFSELARRIVTQGHEVGLHGLDHRRMSGLGMREVARRLRDGRRRLETVTGAAIRLLRPPFGSQSVRSYAVARYLGLDVVVWNRYAEDWSPAVPEEMARRALSSIGRGDILLLHDGFEPDPEAPMPDPATDRAKVAELVLSQLAQRGLRGVSVSALVESGRARKTVWFRP